MTALIIVASILGFIILIFALFAYITYRMIFGKRNDKKEYLKYFTAADFNITYEPVNITDKINGAIYGGAKDCGKLIIFCHGLGAGHAAYMTEIAHFCALGYTVLAADCLGCGISYGKSLRGMYEGVRTVISAIGFSHSNERLSCMPVYLVGHSWGGYSALCASKFKKVNAVVAISAPATPTKTFADGAKKALSKPVAFALSPFWYLINFFHFGTKGNLNAAKCADKNGTPTLLVHGDSDNVVSIENAVINKVKGGEEKYIAKGKAHNPYNTAEAEKLLQTLFNVNPDTEEGQKFFKEFDFKKATEEDSKVMQVISDFLNKC